MYGDNILLENVTKLIFAAGRCHSLLRPDVRTLLKKKATHALQTKVYDDQRPQQMKKYIDIR